MTINDIFADQLAANLGFVQMTVGDFSDADMLARTSPAANHTAWTLGHLIVSEVETFNALKPGAIPELPAGFADRFTKEQCACDDASKFPKKFELLDLFTKTRNATIAFAKSATPAELEKSTPDWMQSWARTTAHLFACTPEHVNMHVGQVQSIRRKLGKPILF